MESYPHKFQLFFAAFILLIGALQIATMWFRGRHQRREDPDMVRIHKRVLVWYFLAVTTPFLVLFGGAELTNLSVYQEILAGSFGHATFILAAILLLFYAAGFAYYIFMKNGAEELVRLRPIIRVKPESLNTVTFWKCLGALSIPLQLLSFYWIYYFSTQILLPVNG